MMIRRIAMVFLTLLFLVACGCTMSFENEDQGVINYLQSKGIKARYQELGRIYVKNGKIFYSAKIELELPPDFEKYLSEKGVK